MTADNDKKDDEVVLGAFTLEKLALRGGSSGPNTCAFEAGVGRAEPDEVMAKCTDLQSADGSQFVLKVTEPKALALMAAETAADTRDPRQLRSGSQP